MSGQQQQQPPQSPPVQAGYHNDGAGENDDDEGNGNVNINYDNNNKAASRQQAENTGPKGMRRSTHGSLSSRAAGGGGASASAGVAAATTTAAPRQKKARILGIPRWTLGIALLLVTVLMWTTSSFLASVCLLSTSLRFNFSSLWSYFYGAFPLLVSLAISRVELPLLHVYALPLQAPLPPF
jgi:hypothetical protein